MGAVVRKDYLFEEPEGETTLDDTGTHDRITTFLITEIGHYLKGKKCEVFHDLNVFLFNEDIGRCKNIFQPDVLIGCDRNKVTDRGYEGTPDFIVEVVSKTSARTDYIVKCDAYMRFGVKEYWVIDTFQRQIIVNLNTFDGSYKITSYTFDDVIIVSVLEDLSIDFKEIMRIIQ